MKKIVSLVLVLAMALICSAAFAEGGIPADHWRRERGLHRRALRGREGNDG